MTGCIGDAPPSAGHGAPDDGTAPADARPPGDAGPAGDAAVFRCRERITTGLDPGHHNPGQDCQDGCHDHGFYMSGTMYGSSGQALSGVSITFTDATGYTADMVSGTNGNFWCALPVTFPVTIKASSCPDIATMTTTLTGGDGGCNKTGCHTGSGGAGRIHVP